jgi:hypothetical protein
MAVVVAVRPNDSGVMRARAVLPSLIFLLVALPASAQVEPGPQRRGYAHLGTDLVFGGISLSVGVSDGPRRLFGTRGEGSLGVEYASGEGGGPYSESYGEMHLAAVTASWRLASEKYWGEPGLHSGLAIGASVGYMEWSEISGPCPCTTSEWSGVAVGPTFSYSLGHRLLVANFLDSPCRSTRF